MLDNLRSYSPSASWLTHLAESNQSKIKDPTTIEVQKRKCCNLTVLYNFYLKNYNILKNTNPHLLWNADEASHTSTRQFKCLAGLDMNVYTSEKRTKNPHVTTMFCYNAIGEKMKPFIILLHMPYLLFAFESDFNVYFASQQNGWMTCTLFGSWTVHFVSELKYIRMQIPNEIRNQQAVLFVDIHTSCINSFAVEFLKMNNVILLTLPAHCNHVLQTFES